MKSYNIKKPLISIHIPKCGGTSLKAVLKGWFGEKLYFHYFNERENKLPEKHIIEKPNMCIHGHFNKQRNFGVQDYYPNVDQFITFMRDPFDMLISRYFYVRKAGVNSFRNGKRLEVNQDLTTYLKQVIFKKDYEPNLLNYMPFRITGDNYKEIINKHFVYIGVLEDFQYSVDKLAEKLGFPPVKVKHLNVSIKHEPVSERLRKQFIDSHPIEFMVYDYVLEHYTDL